MRHEAQKSSHSQGKWRLNAALFIFLFANPTVSGLEGSFLINALARPLLRASPTYDLRVFFYINKKIKMIHGRLFKFIALLRCLPLRANICDRCV